MTGHTPIASDIPLIDLHRHLDGNVRLETVLAIGREHRVALPADTVEGLRPFGQVQGTTPSLMDFIAKFELLKLVFIDEDAIARIAEENVEDAFREGIAYIELRLSPAFMGERYHLDPAAVLRACCRGVRAGMAKYPVRAQLIGIMSRHLGEETCWRELDAAISCMGDGVVAIDLAGDERNFPGSRFVKHFRRAREAGLRVTVHAGEADGPASVRQAIEELGAERIGHGVTAAQDPALLDLIAARGIAIESSPTSNLQTSTVPSYATHPLPMFLRRGLCVTLNSDDPGISAIDLPHEYRVARDEMGLGDAELRQLQLNALGAAFLPEGAKQALLEATRQ
jgi:adenosine deaminase